MHKNKKNKSLSKLYTQLEAKEFIDNELLFEFDSKSIVKKMTNELNDDSFKCGNIASNTHKGLEQYLKLNSLNNHLLLTKSCNEDYQPLIVQFSKDLIEEYQCTTSSEKALVHTIAIAYYRILNCSRLYNNEMNTKSISRERTELIKSHGKELDRANRQFISALETLKLIKQPAIKINLKADNAYLAENQQIITNNNDEK